MVIVCKIGMQWMLIVGWCVMCITRRVCNDFCGGINGPGGIVNVLGCILFISLGIGYAGRIGRVDIASLVIIVTIRIVIIVIHWIRFYPISSSKRVQGAARWHSWLCVSANK
jgi:hypothetical protein